MQNQNEFDTEAFAGFDDLIQEVEASPEYAEESLVGEAQSLIVQQMDAQGLSRADLAQLLGVSKARVTQMLSPECKNLTLRLLGRAAHALQLNLRLVRAEQVVARKRDDGRWCIGTPWDEPGWYESSLLTEERVANDRAPVDLGRTQALLRQAVAA